MKVLCDANIWIDLASRPESFPDTIRAVKKLQSASVKLLFPASSYTTVYYILSKVLLPEAALNFLQLVAGQGVSFIPFGSQEIAVAQSLEVSDHEDACIVSQALGSKCDYIMTRDTKHFRNIPIKIVQPKEVLEWQF